MDAKSRLVFRMKEGLGSDKYRPADYAKLKLHAAEKKIAAQRSLFKVQKISELSRQTRENQTLQQHHLAWQKENLRLGAARRKLNNELDTHLRRNLTDPDLKALYSELNEYQADLEEDLSDFKTATSDPVWTLREDLKYWLVENSTAAQEGELDQENSLQVKDTVISVKDQQQRIVNQLKSEESQLSTDLKQGDIPILSYSHHLEIEHGIPEAAFDLDSPSHELKVNILQEFILLDERYWNRLTELETLYSNVVNSPTGGWDEESHAEFCCIVEQYSHETPNRHKLVLDRLSRHFRHRTKQQLTEHLSWIGEQHFFVQRRRDLVTDWQRERAELLSKAKATLAEACLEDEQTHAREHDAQKQKQRCQLLYDKVVTWRKQKEELFALEQAAQEERLEKARQKQELTDEKEKLRRNKDKQQVRAYHVAKERKLRHEQQKQARRMEELRRQLEEQAKLDKERVEFREKLLEQRHEELRHRQMELADEEEAREHRLELLRQQVRPEVEFDPMRLHGDTQSWKQRLRQSHDADDYLQKPLFDIHTYTAKKIVADPRVRLETELRAAGLEKSDYARHVLKRVPPPQPPRRDTESTAFKHLNTAI